MKLYDSIGPNPHVVRMFIAEKGIEYLQKINGAGGFGASLLAAE